MTVDGTSNEFQSLAAMLELAPDPALVLDKRTRVIVASSAAARLFGRSTSDLRGLDVGELIGDGVLDPEAKLRARRPDGRLLPVEISARVIDVDGESALSVAVRDVTARRRTAAGLREAGERFRRLFENGPVAMALADETHLLVEVNAAFCELTGRSAVELLGMGFNEISHPDDRDVAARLTRRAYAGEIEGFQLDKRYVHKDGGVVWVELTATILHDEDGVPVQTLAVAQDITERRRALARAQQELDRLERAHDRILEYAGEGIYHVDGEGLVTFANPAAARALGTTIESLLGKPAHELLHHTRPDGSHYPRAECPIHGRRPGVEVRQAVEDRFFRRDGSSFPVNYTAAPANGPGDEGTVIVFTDVSREAATSAALARSRARAARERLQAAEAERARWARELHDETLQGLAALHVHCSSGLRTADVEDMAQGLREAQEHIESEMDKLRGLIADLRPAALDDLGLEASVRDLAQRTEAIYGIEVCVESTLGSGPDARRLDAEVETSAYRIAQECLSNAARHARADRVIVELGPASGDHLLVRVTDDGDGFDPATDDVGFGLRGMRERVELLEGSLTVRSSPGAGAAVEARVPIDQVGTSELSTRPRSSA